MTILTTAKEISGNVALASSRFKFPVDSLISTGCLSGLRHSENWENQLIKNLIMMIDDLMIR